MSGRFSASEIRACEHPIRFASWTCVKANTLRSSVKRIDLSVSAANILATLRDVIADRNREQVVQLHSLNAIISQLAFAIPTIPHRLYLPDSSRRFRRISSIATSALDAAVVYQVSSTPALSPPYSTQAAPTIRFPPDGTGVGPVHLRRSRGQAATAGGAWPRLQGKVRMIRMPAPLQCVSGRGAAHEPEQALLRLSRTLKLL